MARLLRTTRFVFHSVTVGLAAAFLAVLLWPERFFPGDDGDPVSYAAAVERAAPAVVNVHSARRVTQRHPLYDAPLLREFFGEPPPQPERMETSLGSGVIVDTAGLVMTNYHVVAGADEIRVALLDGRVSAARVVGTDQETDLALLSIDLDGLPTIPVGRADTLRVGDVVLAIGNPYDIGQTVTQGIISATGRNYLGLTTFENFIQTDAAINPGNSGGALINTRGELVGINTAYYSRAGGSQGIGFAIPVDLARGVMSHLVEHGRVLRGWVGVEPQDLTPELAEAMSLEVTRGIIVARVVPDSPADRAGLEPLDIITHVDGEPVHDARDALNRVAALPPGTEATLRVIRDGRTLEVRVTTGERGARD